MGVPTERHEDRRRILDALAVLTGHVAELPGLPDGRRPDVARLNLRRRTVFLGEAKDTETARCVETQTRLLAYARWLGAGAAPGAGGLLAVCFGRAADAAGWAVTLAAIAHEADLKETTVSVERLGRATWCAALCVGVPLHDVAGMGRGG